MRGEDSTQLNHDGTTIFDTENTESTEFHRVIFRLKYLVRKMR